MASKNLITRIRHRIAQGDLSADTEQLLRDLDAALTRMSAPPHLASPSSPSLAPLVDAALRHAAALGAGALVEPIPGTELIVALGEPLEVLNILQISWAPASRTNKRATSRALSWQNVSVSSLRIRARVPMLPNDAELTFAVARQNRGQRC